MDDLPVELKTLVEQAVLTEGQALAQEKILDPVIINRLAELGFKITGKQRIDKRGITGPTNIKKAQAKRSGRTQVDDEPPENVIEKDFNKGIKKLTLNNTDDLTVYYEELKKKEAEVETLRKELQTRDGKYKDLKGELKSLRKTAKKLARNEPVEFESSESESEPEPPQNTTKKVSKPKKKVIYISEEENSESEQEPPKAKKAVKPTKKIEPTEQAKEPAKPITPKEDKPAPAKPVFRSIKQF